MAHDERVERVLKTLFERRAYKRGEIEDYEPDSVLCISDDDFDTWSRSLLTWDEFKAGNLFLDEALTLDYREMWSLVDEVLAALTAADAPLEDVLLRSGLVSDGLPGHDIGIAYHDGEWHASQQHVTMGESWPTGVVGTGPTVAEAIRAAVDAARKEAG